MRCLLILAITALHFVVSFVALWISFGDSMSRFEESLPPREPSSLERIADVLVRVLHLPLASLWPSSVPGGIWVFALNSLLWGVCIYHGSRFLLRKFRRA